MAVKVATRNIVAERRFVMLALRNMKITIVSWGLVLSLLLVPSFAREQRSSSGSADRSSKSASPAPARVAPARVASPAPAIVSAPPARPAAPSAPSRSTSRMSSNQTRPMYNNGTSLNTSTRSARPTISTNTTRPVRSPEPALSTRTTTPQIYTRPVAPSDSATRSATRTIPTRIQRTVTTSTPSATSSRINPTARQSGDRISTGSMISSSNRTIATNTRTSGVNSTRITKSISASSPRLSVTNRTTGRTDIIEPIRSNPATTTSGSRINKSGDTSVIANSDKERATKSTIGRTDITESARSNSAATTPDSRMSKSGDTSAIANSDRARPTKSTDRQTKSEARTDIDRSSPKGDSSRPAATYDRQSKSGDLNRGVVKSSGSRDMAQSPRLRKNDNVRPIRVNKTVNYNYSPVIVNNYGGREYCYRDYYNYRSRSNYWDFRLFGYWPSSRFSIVYESPGLSLSFGYVYPRYHRKYVFVSVGGWWPSYDYQRYYWYGYHPYRWYGYYPEVYEINNPGTVNSNNSTNNYYTYNYYYGDTGDNGATTRTVMDSSQLANAQQLQSADIQPATAGRADELFDTAVKAFEEGSYDRAANIFADAMRLAGDDVVLPFAYSQALFADGQYVSAAQALRTAFQNLPADKEDMFYPRGLYAKEETLTQQIDTLGTKVDSRAFDTDLQLLLGYHLVGIGQLDDAIPHLQRAAGASENKPAADKLLKLIERVLSQTNNNTNG